MMVRERGQGDDERVRAPTAGAASATGTKIVPTSPRPPALSERERRWLWVTDAPYLACALAALAWLPTQRAVSPWLCVGLVVGFALAGNVRVLSPRTAGFFPATQLVFVPILSKGRGPDYAPGVISPHS